MTKICKIELYLFIILKAPTYINEASYHRQTIFNQLNIMVPYVDIYSWSMS